MRFRSFNSYFLAVIDMASSLYGGDYDEMEEKAYERRATLEAAYLNGESPEDAAEILTK